MLRAILFFLVIADALLVSKLAAQPASPPVENVTVTGARSRQAIEGFVQSLATPTRATDKVARWQQGICPLATGLRPAFLAFITKRLKDVAAQVGAPVNNSTSCETNIVIVFTTAPQALVDNVKKKQPGLLGYYENQEQQDKLTAVTHALQAWYTTATQGLIRQGHGGHRQDGWPGIGLVAPMQSTLSRDWGGICTLQPSGAHGASVTGSRLGDGLRSGLYNVIIVADPTKLVDYEIGSLSDYIAMLALAQIGSLDACQSLASVLNMLARNCAGKPSALTDNDLSYLRALYKMSPDSTIRVQRDEMTYQMQQSLGVH